LLNTTEKNDVFEPRPSASEEWANASSHALGFLFSLVAGFFLIARAAEHDRPWSTFGACTFVAGCLAVYLASTLYHASPQGQAKRILRRLEHCAIFLLIAGTYTPVTLVSLRANHGCTLLGLVWGLSALGIILKLTCTTNHRWLPAVLYLTLGWLILVVIRPLAIQLPLAGLMWMLAGGVAYTVGMAFFAARQVPYCHFVWHLFVLAGTTCHFVALWHYVV
jgi:hemolysin III